MSKRTFLLDRDDFRRYAAVLPDDPHRDELEYRLRDTHTAYRAHLARRASLEADIRNTTRKLAGNPDLELSARLSALLAEQSIWPELMTERAGAYARALAAWAGHTWQAFADAGNREIDALSTTGDTFRRLTNRLCRFHHASPEYAAARAELDALRAAEVPHIRRRRAAQSGMGAIEAELSFTFPGVVRGSVPSHHITAWVNQHRQMSAAA